MSMPIALARIAGRLVQIASPSARPQHRTEPIALPLVTVLTQFKKTALLWGTGPLQTVGEGAIPTPTHLVLPPLLAS